MTDEYKSDADKLAELTLFYVNLLCNHQHITATWVGCAKGLSEAISKDRKAGLKPSQALLMELAACHHVIEERQHEFRFISEMLDKKKLDMSGINFVGETLAELIKRTIEESSRGVFVKASQSDRQNVMSKLLSTKLDLSNEEQGE